MKMFRNVENLLRGEEGGCCVPIGMPKHERPMGTYFLDIVLNGHELCSMYTNCGPYLHYTYSSNCLIILP